MSSSVRESPGGGRDDSPVRVVLVDDHELFRTGLSELLTEHGFAIVGEASTGEEGVALVAEVAPDVAVVDVGMPGIGGIRAAREITTSTPACQVLMLSVSTATDDVLDAIQAGACGYVLKDLAAVEIATAVAAAARGDSVLSPAITGEILERIREEPGFAEAADERPQLTARELAVLRLLAQGKGNGEIATELGISIQTVKTHVSSVLVKLAVDNRIQAAVAAVRNRLV